MIAPTLTLAFVIALPLVAGAAEKGSPLSDLTQRYLDGLFRAKPHLATFMGDHRFDGALPDLSAEAIARREAELLAVAEALAKLKPQALDEQIDAEIMRNGIELERLYLDEIRDWEWDPRLHDS